MTKQFVFFYLMKNAPDKVRELVPAHINYWRTLELPDYSGGPFAGRSGGLIVFKSATLEAAINIVNHDPFMQNNVIDSNWTKELLPE